MSRLYYFPLEHIEQRYTKQLDAQLIEALRHEGINFIRINGEPLSAGVPDGMFLNAPSTTHYKATQLQHMAQLFAAGHVETGDVFFFSDLWFPGLEALPYLAYFADVKVYTTGLLHAGSFTETDFVANMRPWAQHIERGWLQFCDAVFLGSNHIHGELVQKGHAPRLDNLHVTGLPFSTKYLLRVVPARVWEEKEDLVVFTGRLCDEKQPWLFDEAERYVRQQPGLSMARFVKTQEQDLDKAEYLDLLSRAKVCVSFALQENFGYGCLEAAAYGCSIVAPNALAYPELYPPACLYDTKQEAFDRIAHILSLSDENGAVHSSFMYNAASMHNANVHMIAGHLVGLLER